MNNVQISDNGKLLTEFTLKMSTLIDTGVSIVRSLYILEKDLSKPFADVVCDMKQHIMDGANLSDAMTTHSEIFSSFYVKMIHVGEIGGILEESFRYLAEFLDEGWKIQQLTGQKVNWEWMLSPANLQMPSDWIELSEQQKIIISMMFCRSLGMMLTAGVPMNLSLEVAADLLPLVQREQIQALSKCVIDQQIVSALDDIGILHQFASGILKVGEASGLLNVTLEKVAQVYERLLISGIM